MLKAIVKVLKRASRVIGRIDIYTLDFAREFLFERFEGKKIIPENEPIVEQIMVAHTLPKPTSSASSAPLDRGE